MPRKPAFRAPLSREAVLRAAIALADEEGADSLSMRKLADRLGVVPMALYKHIADKEDLLDGMVEVLLRDLAPVTITKRSEWRAAVVTAIDAVRRLHRAHPWLRRVLETRTLRTPAVLMHMEQLTSAFLAGGFTADLTHHVMHLLGNRIWGFSPELFNESGGTADRRSTAAAPDPADYPGILAVAVDAAARRPPGAGCDEDVEFAFALDVMLDAAERLRRSKWSSPDSP